MDLKNLKKSLSDLGYLCNINDNNVISYNLIGLEHYNYVNIKDTYKYFDDEESYVRFLVTFYEKEFKEEINTYMIKINREFKLHNILNRIR